MPLNKTSICESIKAAATVVAVSTVVPAVAAATIWLSLEVSNPKY